MSRAARARNVLAGDNYIVSCALCPTRGLRSEMVWMTLDVPGHPRRQALVHVECYDQPHPRATRPRPRAWMPPEHVQIVTHTDTATISTPTVSAVTTPISAGAATNVTVTGTNFTDFCRARINGLTRPTTVNSSTSITMSLYADDARVGTHAISVRSFKPPQNGDSATSGNVTLTVS